MPSLAVLALPFVLYSALSWLPAERLQRNSKLPSLKVTLDHIGAPSALKYHNQTLESYVCSNAGPKGRITLPTSQCKDNETYVRWTCLVNNFRKKHIRACKRNSRDPTCLMILVYIKDVRSLLSRFGKDWATMCSRYYGRKEPFEVVVSSEIMQSCNLTTPGNGILRLGDGRMKNARCSIFSSPYTLRIFYARIAVILLLRSPAGETNVTKVRHSIGCWNPEMARARRIYYAPGRWDVDDACIDVIQAVGLKMGKHLVTVCLGEMKEEVRRRSPAGQMLFKVILSFVTIGRHYIREIKFYRLFKRFRALAKERRSAKNLRSNRGVLSRVTWNTE